MGTFSYALKIIETIIYKNTQNGVVPKRIVSSLKSNPDSCKSIDNKYNDKNKLEINKKIFEGDVECIKKSDLLIFDLNGRVPDEGGCVELGMAYAWGIKSIGFKTDTRALDYTGDDNLMIEGCMNFKVARSLEELEKMLKEV